MFGTLINLFRNVYLLGGLALYSISIVVWLIVLSRAEVSAAYPLASLGFIITAVIAYFLLGEQVTFMRLSGILLICLGVILVASSA